MNDKIIGQLRDINDKQFKCLKQYEIHKAKAEECMKKINRYEEQIKVLRQQLLELQEAKNEQ